MYIKKRLYKYNDHRQETDPFYQSKFWRMLRKACLIRDNFLCQICKSKGIIKPGRIADHITPRNHGGKDELDNLQTVCDSCHAIKSAKEKL